MPPSDEIFILLDGDNCPSPASETIYLWNGYGDSEDQRSLLSFCDENAERLREKYCKWVYDLGQTVVGAIPLVERLALEGGPSYWWMTWFVEQSPWTSPAIDDAIRLLALEEIVAQRKPAKFLLVSADRRLHEIVSGFCQGMGIAYEWERLPDKSSRRLSLKDIYHGLPQAVQALVNLVRLLWEQWSLRQGDKSGWFSGEKTLFLCADFIYFVPALAEKGHFHSRYWGGLSGLMGKLGVSGNWLQRYKTHAAVPSLKSAMDLTKRFNRNRKEQDFHGFPNAYLSWRSVLRILKRWLHLTLISYRLRKIKRAFQLKGSYLSFWPLMRRDWYASMRGPAAISNLLSIELFDMALRDIPHQKRGLYICENQAWERALIYAWRKHGHGQLVAVPHTAQIFWDLRYFYDARARESASAYPLPQPDLTAVHGKAAEDVFIHRNYPKKSLIECEALRYDHLIGLGARYSSSRAKNATIKVLIVGEYLPSGAIRMLQLLEAANKLMRAPVTYTMKPHPNYPIKPADYPSLNLLLVTDPLEKILHDFDVVYSGNTTSAAVDAYFAGLPVVVMLDDRKLNYSPLRGWPGARFVSKPGMLAEALQASDEGTAREPGEFFFLDPELPRWQKILLA